MLADYIRFKPIKSDAFARKFSSSSMIASSAEKSTIRSPLLFKLRTFGTI